MKHILKGWLFVLLSIIACDTTQVLSRDCNESCDRNNCSVNCNDNCGTNNCNVSGTDLCNDVCGNSCDNKNNCSNDYAYGRTTFKSPRSLTTASYLDLALGNYYFYHHVPCPEDRAFFQVQASYFHLQSKEQCELAGYFLPNGSRCIDVRQDGSGQVGSLWLGLSSPAAGGFNSTVCLSPRRKVDGGFFNFYFDFSNWLCGTWASVAFAVARVEHQLCLRESVNSTPGVLTDVNSNALITDAIAAFNNPNWNAGKLYRGCRTRTGVDDVQFKLGWNYYFCNMDHLGVYFVATGPTGCRTRNEYLFDAVVGSRHGSVGVGLNTDYTLWDCEDHAVNWMVDLKYRFILPHCERRLFDLKNNGPWSRYLSVAAQATPGTALPGVNYFAHDVDVRPGSTIDFWTALNYHWCNWNLELGYDLFWRDCEEICLKRAANLGVGIYDLSGAALGNPVSASNANITQTAINQGFNVAASDAAFVTLSTSDLNVASGAHPRALTHTIYGGFSYTSEVWCLPIMLGFVGSYEFARCNTAFEQWGVQFRTAISF